MVVYQSMLRIPIFCIRFEEVTENRNREENSQSVKTFIDLMIHFIDLLYIDFFN